MTKIINIPRCSCNDHALDNSKGIPSSNNDDCVSLNMLLKTNSSDDPTVATISTVSCIGESDDTDGYVRDNLSVASFSTVGLNCVSFDETLQIQEIPNRWDYTVDELDACWYGSREKEVMREAAFGIAESLDYLYFQDAYGNPTSTKFRGLETYTVKGSAQRKLNRVKNLVSVLREQRRQRTCGEVVTNGPELLEAVCRTVSSQCAKRAYIQGIQDERDAQGTEGAQARGLDQSPNVLLHLTQLFRDLGQSNHTARKEE